MSTVRVLVGTRKGAFIIESVLPGEYTLIAFPDDDQLTPVFLRHLELVGKYERFGQRVHVEAGQTQQVTLRTVPAIE